MPTLAIGQSISSYTYTHRTPRRSGCKEFSRCSPGPEGGDVSRWFGVLAAALHKEYSGKAGKQREADRFPGL